MSENLDILFIKSIKASKIDQDFENRFKEIEENLMGKLNKEELGLFVDYIDAHHQHICRRSTDYFKRGFWIGYEIAREVAEL